MSVVLAALGAAAASLLYARGKPRLAELAARAHVEIAGEGEPWSIGNRTVTAHRVALVVSAPAFLELSSDAARIEAVKEAFAQAMRSPGTELLALHVELALPGDGRAWSGAYREAPVRHRPVESPDPEAILAGAAALLEAMGDRPAAALLGRARLESAFAPGAETPLTRYLVRLAPADRARTLADVALGDKVRRAVHDAAIRAGEAATVELATTLPDSGLRS
ncbi:MAG: hypothetical protein ABJE95_08405 [Byssovorax sp.]